MGSSHPVQARGRRKLGPTRIARREPGLELARLEHPRAFSFMGRSRCVRAARACAARARRRAWRHDARADVGKPARRRGSQRRADLGFSRGLAGAGSGSFLGSTGGTGAGSGSGRATRSVVGSSSGTRSIVGSSAARRRAVGRAKPARLGRPAD